MKRKDPWKYPALLKREDVLPDATEEELYRAKQMLEDDRTLTETDVVDELLRLRKMSKKNPYIGFKKLGRKIRSKALRAWIGRKKYGKKAFAKMSAAGRRRGRKNPKRMPSGLHRHWGKVNTILGIAASAFVVYHYVNKYRTKGTV